MLPGDQFQRAGAEDVDRTGHATREIGNRAHRGRREPDAPEPPAVAGLLTLRSCARRPAAGQTLRGTAVSDPKPPLDVLLNLARPQGPELVLSGDPLIQFPHLGPGEDE